MKVLKKIIKWSIVSLLLITVLVLIAFAVTTYGLGWDYGKILSGSMYPALDTGDLVAVSPFSGVGDIKVGDIISFRYPESDHPVMHRVVGISSIDGETIFRTKGDFNAEMSASEWIGYEDVPASDVIGKFVFRIPQPEIIVYSFFGSLFLMTIFFLVLSIIDKPRPRRRLAYVR